MYILYGLLDPESRLLDLESGLKDYELIILIIIHNKVRHLEKYPYRADLTTEACL